MEIWKGKAATGRRPGWMSSRSNSGAFSPRAAFISRRRLTTRFIHNSRDRLAFSKSILKRFLRDCLDRDATSATSPWIVKPALAAKYDIPTELTDSFKKEIEGLKEAASRRRKRKVDDDPVGSGLEDEREEIGEDGQPIIAKRKRRTKAELLAGMAFPCFLESHFGRNAELRRSSCPFLVLVSPKRRNQPRDRTATNAGTKEARQVPSRRFVQPFWLVEPLSFRLTGSYFSQTYSALSLHARSRRARLSSARYPPETFPSVTISRRSS